MEPVSLQIQFLFILSELFICWLSFGYSLFGLNFLLKVQCTCVLWCMYEKNVLLNFDVAREQSICMHANFSAVDVILKRIEFFFFGILD